MPGYVAKALKQFQHKKPSNPKQALLPTKFIKNGAKQQYATSTSTAPFLDNKDKKFIQQVCGKFLFLERVINSTLICVPLLLLHYAKPTQDTMDEKLKVLDYLASQKGAVMSYSASDMILVAHSDASYLSRLKAHSWAGRHFFLSSTAYIPPNNGAILKLLTS